MKRIQVDGRFREVERVEELKPLKQLQLYNALIAKKSGILEKKAFFAKLSDTIENFECKL